jgi:ribose transport system ATP-binding protein
VLVEGAELRCSSAPSASSGADVELSESTPTLEVRGLVKRYGGTLALDRASLVCGRDEAHGLVGENGAGKSTLVKILTGLVSPDEGEILLDGSIVRFRSPRDAVRAGIAAAFQELNLVPYMTVAENLLIGREPRGAAGLVSGGRLRAKARDILAEWDADDIDASVAVGRLPLATQQRIEIVRALSRRPRLLLLDEPTSALGVAEAQWLHTQIARMREAGASIVFISHRLGEIVDTCDRVTVLRNGRQVATLDPEEAGHDEVVRLMLGRRVEDEYGRRSSRVASDAEVSLEVEHLTCRPDLHGASLVLHAGEILGVAGLEGQGQRALFMALFGARRRDAGTIRIGGEVRKLRSPRDAVRAGLGISFVPPERKVEGLMLTHSGTFNASLPSIASHFANLGFVRPRKERAAAREIFARLGVPTRALYEPVESLSGGNQQKVAIGKWLPLAARILLMYDPMRGVDIATKAELFSLMHELAAEGRSILFYSTDLEELVNVCDRVLVVYGGRVVRELAGDELTLEIVLASILGADDPQEAA